MLRRMIFAAALVAPLALAAAVPAAAAPVQLAAPAHHNIPRNFGLFYIQDIGGNFAGNCITGEGHNNPVSILNACPATVFLKRVITGPWYELVDDQSGMCLNAAFAAPNYVLVYEDSCQATTPEQWANNVDRSVVNRHFNKNMCEDQQGGGDGFVGIQQGPFGWAFPDAS